MDNVRDLGIAIQSKLLFSIRTDPPKSYQNSRAFFI